MIWSGFRYLIGGKLEMLQWCDFGCKTGPIALVQDFVWYDLLKRFGSWSELQSEPTQKFGTLADSNPIRLPLADPILTMQVMLVLWVMSFLLLLLLLSLNGSSWPLLGMADLPLDRTTENSMVYSVPGMTLLQWLQECARTCTLVSGRITVWIAIEGSRLHTWIWVREYVDVTVKILVADRWLVASRLYKTGDTQPWTPYVQPCHYIFPLPRRRTPGLPILVL